MEIRRILPALALCLGLTACAAADAAPRLPLAGHTGNYDTSLTATQGTLETTATITRSTPGTCRVEFLTPDSLAGMAYVYHEDGVDVLYGELQFTFDPRSLPGTALAEIAVSALGKSVNGDGIQVAEGETGTLLSGTVDAGPFTLLLDSETEVPLKLSVPSQELEIAFSNFRFLD